MIFNSILVGLLGWAILWLIYFGLKSGWPAAYVALSETYALTAPQRWWRLSLFRLVPTLLASVALVVTAWRVGVVDWVVLLVAVGLHLITTNGVGLIESLRSSLPSRRVNYGAYHLTNIVALSLVAVSGALLSPYAVSLIPPPHEFINNLWTAAFVAAVGAAFLHVAAIRAKNQQAFGSAYFLTRAIRDAGIEIFDETFAAALRHNADPLLLKAILIVEVLQRPRWFRRLERLKGRFIRRGSYGVMQVEADGPISDTESIEATAKAFSGTFCWSYNFDLQTLEVSDSALWSAAGTHNGDLEFIKSVGDIYRYLATYISPWSFGPGSTVWRIVEVRRFSESFTLRGVTNARKVRIESADSDIHSEKETAANNGSWAVVELWVGGGTRAIDIYLDGELVSANFDFQQMVAYSGSDV